jgi:hypothetical protein
MGRHSVLAGRGSRGWPRLRDADLADHRRSVRSLSVESVHSWPFVHVIVWGTILSVLFAHGSAAAHSGPPFPIVSSRTAGPYDVSVWTDPDSTDDGSAGGQFWVTVRPSGGTVALPAGTRVSVAIRPLDRSGSTNTGNAEPIATDASQRFVALSMDHEGRFHVRVAIDGPLGPADVEAEVDATYDLRPPPVMIAVYLIPFVLAGFLWVKLLLKRKDRS